MKQQKKPRMLPWRVIAAAIIAVAAVVDIHAEESCYLNIYGASSVYEMSYQAEEVNKVTFSDESLTVHLTSSNRQQTVPYTELLKITFGEQAFTGIDDTQSSDFTIRYMSATHIVNILSNTSIDCVQLFNTQGQLLHVSTPRDAQAFVDISNYASGIYIVRATSGTQVQTKKIIR